MTEDELQVLKRIQKYYKSDDCNYCYLISIIEGVRYYKYGRARVIYGYYGLPLLVSIGRSGRMNFINGYSVFKYFLTKSRNAKILALAKSLGFSETKKIIGCTLAYNINDEGEISEYTYLSVGKDKNDSAYELNSDQLHLIDEEILRKRKIGLQFVRDNGGKKINLISCSDDIYNTVPSLYHRYDELDVSQKWLLGFDYLDFPFKVKGHFMKSFMRCHKENKPFIDIIEARLKQHQ